MLNELIKYRPYFVAVKRRKYGRKPVVLRSRHGIFYLAKVSVNREMRDVPSAKSRVRRSFIKTVNKYMNGDKCAYEKITDVYLRYVEDFIEYKKLEGNIELINIPSASSDKINPIAQTISRICLFTDKKNVKLCDGSGKLLRDKPKSKVDLFDRYSVDELAKTIHITGDVRTDTVILLEDACLGFNMVDACKRVLKDAGIKKVYVLCLYMGCG